MGRIRKCHWYRRINSFTVLRKSHFLYLIPSLLDFPWNPALDILRGRNQLPTLLEDIRRCKGADTKVDAYISSLESSLREVLSQGQSGGTDSQAYARNIVDRLATAMQASVLLRFGDAKVGNGKALFLYLL